MLKSSKTKFKTNDIIENRKKITKHYHVIILMARVVIIYRSRKSIRSVDVAMIIQDIITSDKHSRTMGLKVQCYF